MNAIDIKNLTFFYEKDIVLEDINLNVKDGEFLAIIGPNGGGKSTLLKLILGIEKNRSGTIKVFDKKPSKNLTKVGYVPQNTNVNIDFPIKVIEVVMMGHVGHKRPLIGYKKGEIECALASLEQVGMQKYAKNKIGSLSGGQRQRVMIARALCSHPKIVLLDEPTSNIDIVGQKEIYALLKELNRHITIVVVSHDLSIVSEYATSVLHVSKKATYHNIGKKKKNFTKDKHFCEVELLQMIGERHV